MKCSDGINNWLVKAAGQSHVNCDSGSEST